MKRLKIEPIDAEAFAPFGQLLPPAPPGSGRQELIDELHNGRAGARPRLSIATTEPKALPLAAVQMERHVHSSQAFVIIVALWNGDRLRGERVMEDVQAFGTPQSARSDRRTTPIYSPSSTQRWRQGAPTGRCGRARCPRSLTAPSTR